jgi:hypothetical protein
MVLCEQRTVHESASLQAQLDLRPYVITCGEPKQNALPPLELRRGRVTLTLLLPTGSEPGPYTVEVRDSSAATKRQRAGPPDFETRFALLMSC